MIIYTFEIYMCGFETIRISITEDVVKKVSTYKDGVCFGSKNGGYKTPIRFVQCFNSECFSNEFEAIMVSFLGHKKIDVMKLFNKFQDMVEKKSI